MQVPKSAPPEAALVVEFAAAAMVVFFARANTGSVEAEAEKAERRMRRTVLVYILTGGC